MKSAYEIALERMERQGIEPPSDEKLSTEIRERMAEARRRAEARLAEIEILHRDRMRGLADPEERRQAEDDYRRDRQRVEERRDRDLERLRGGG